MTTEQTITPFDIVAIKVSEEQVRDLLCGAFEGGAGYWIEDRSYRLAEGVKEEDFREGGRLTKQEYWPPYLLVPFISGCAVVILTEEPPSLATDKTRYELTTETLKRGLQVMADKYTHHWCDFLRGEYDATTSDVFLQCCLFGEVAFG